jgi:hypothetical protein
MSWADAQPALASGAVDGQENPLTIFTAAKLHTVGQKNVTLWGYVADPLIFVVEQGGLGKSWTPEDREDRPPRPPSTPALSVTIALFLAIAGYGVRLVIDDYTYETTSPGIGVPQWLYSAWLPVLAAVVALRVGGRALRVLRGRA